MKSALEVSIAEWRIVDRHALNTRSPNADHLAMNRAITAVVTRAFDREVRSQRLASWQTLHLSENIAKQARAAIALKATR